MSSQQSRILAAAARTVALEIGFSWLLDHLARVTADGSAADRARLTQDIARAFADARDEFIRTAFPSTQGVADNPDLARAFGEIERRIANALVKGRAGGDRDPPARREDG